MKKSVYYILVLLFYSGLSFAQDAPEQVLDKKDVTRFIDTFKPMAEEIEALGEEMSTSEDPTMNTIMQNEEVKAILRKYGWGDDFLPKFYVITMGYAYSKMLTEIENMPEEQRNQMTAMVAQYTAQYKSKLHEEDVKLVNAHMDELEQMFESME
ncbi:MAG: hypothetical protein R3345_02030 [Fulvivirga sp.]|nr:hypothetical protein [Fulvivirga sp.]